MAADKPQTETAYEDPGIRSGNKPKQELDEFTKRQRTHVVRALSTSVQRRLRRGALAYGSFTAYGLNGVGSCPLFLPFR
jgi:hypothetical protein